MHIEASNSYKIQVIRRGLADYFQKIYYRILEPISNPIFEMSSILNYKEVSDAVLAALVIHGNRNCGGQFCCGSGLAQTIRLQFAQLCWRCHRRSDSATLLGAIETQGVEGELTKLREGN